MNDDTADRSLLTWREREHARECRELWRSAAAAVARAETCRSPRDAAEWADLLVKDYDQKYRPTVPGREDAK